MLDSWTIEIMDTYRAFEHINRPISALVVYHDEDAIAVALPWDEVFEISLDAYIRERMSEDPQRDMEQNELTYNSHTKDNQDVVDFLRYGLQEGGKFHTWTEVNDELWEGLDLGYPLDLDDYSENIFVDESMSLVEVDLSRLQPHS